MSTKSSFPLATPVIQHIRDWSIRYPLDYWWRTKHQVAFGSPQHLEMTQLDIALEFAEHLMYRRLNERTSSSTNQGTIFDVPVEQITTLEQLVFDENGNITGLKS